MSFLYPGVLWGLFALLIPIIIHLFNFRRYRTVYFSNVRFLRDIKEQTQTQSQLKHWLILAIRLLAITAIVIAFAQPYNTEKTTTNPSKNVVSIYLDNSFSMENRNEDGAVFDLARQQAIEIAESFNESDRFQLVTNNFDGMEQRLWTRDEFIERVEETTISNYSRSFDEVYSRQKDATENEEGQRVFFWLSDFQNAQFPKNIAPEDSSIQLVISPFKTDNRQNLSVDSAYFASPYHTPDQPEVLKVKISNHGESEVEDIPLSLELNGTVESLQSISLEANSSEWFDINYTAATKVYNSGKISIEDYPISFDDNLYFTYSVRDTLSVLSIGENNRAVKSLMESANYRYAQVNVNEIRYDQLGQYDFIFLMELNEIPDGLASELRKYNQNGGSVAIVPGDHIDVNDYFSTASTLGIPALQGNIQNNGVKIKSIAEEHPIYSGVFERMEENINYPEVRNYYTLNTGIGGFESIITLQNDLPFLAATQREGAFIFQFNAGLNDSSGNFIRHALFPPTIYRMVALSGVQSDIYQVMGKEKPFSVAVETQSDRPLRIQGEGFEQIPEQVNRSGKIEIRQLGNLPDDGIFQLVLNEEQMGLVAVNFDRSESVMEYLNSSEITESLGGFKSVEVFDNNRDTSVSMSSFLNANSNTWYYAIVIALLLLIFEIAAIKLYRS